MISNFKEMKLRGEETRKRIEVEKYANGIFSISEAARFVDVSVGEMIDLLVKKGVKSNYSLEDVEESFKSIGELAGKGRS